MFFFAKKGFLDLPVACAEVTRENEFKENKDIQNLRLCEFHKID